MKVTGKLVKLLDTETGTSKTGKEWKKQQFVLETQDEYNPHICITTFGDNIENIKNIKIGTEITAHINVGSKEYNGRYYHNINLWKIETETQTENKKDDLPF